MGLNAAKKHENHNNNVSQYIILKPTYLDIKDFQKCLGQTRKDSQNDTVFWCLPATKPKDCPQKSWKQLVKDQTFKDSESHCRSYGS